MRRPEKLPCQTKTPISTRALRNGSLNLRPRKCLASGKTSRPMIRAVNGTSLRHSSKAKKLFGLRKVTSLSAAGLGAAKRQFIRLELSVNSTSRSPRLITLTQVFSRQDQIRPLCDSPKLPMQDLLQGWGSNSCATELTQAILLLCTRWMAKNLRTSLRTIGTIMCPMPSPKHCILLN